MVKKNMLCLNAPSRDEDSRESHVSVRAKRDAKPHDASRSYTIGSKAVRNYAAVIEIGPNHKSHKYSKYFTLQHSYYFNNINRQCLFNRNIQ